MTSSEIESVPIEHNAERSRFEAVVDGEVSFAAYSVDNDGRWVFDHTVVHPAHRGQGLAGRLVRHALDHARAERRVVVPACSYVVAWLERHPDYRDLVAGR